MRARCGAVIHQSECAARARLSLNGIEPAEVTHDPHSVVVKIRHAVLPRNLEDAAEIGVILDQTMQTDERHPGRQRVAAAVSLGRNAGVTTHTRRTGGSSAKASSATPLPPPGCSELSDRTRPCVVVEMAWHNIPLHLDTVDGDHPWPNANDIARVADMVDKRVEVALGDEHAVINWDDASPPPLLQVVPNPGGEVNGEFPARVAAEQDPVHVVSPREPEQMLVVVPHHLRFPSEHVVAFQQDLDALMSPSPDEREHHVHVLVAAGDVEHSHRLRVVDVVLVQTA